MFYYIISVGVIWEFRNGQLTINELSENGDSITELKDIINVVYDYLVSTRQTLTGNIVNNSEFRIVVIYFKNSNRNSLYLRPTDEHELR